MTMRAVFERHRSSELRLGFTPDDGEGELFVEVLASGFAGCSSIWTSSQELVDFARQLQQTYPLSPDQPIALLGGYEAYAGGPDLAARTHVSLQFRAVGARGEIGCLVRLATPLEQGDRLESQSRVAVELLTHYEELARFARALEMLAEGRIDEAILGAPADQDEPQAK